ncbi:MAG: hypothetical protein MAG453_00912 [Calditrichaeota bacterium]|nr:hypothetical protein [Calditrichota bacterium]
MRPILLPVVAVLTVFAAIAPAQPAPGGWRLSAALNLTQTQNAYSDNWAEEEYGSLSWAFTFNGLAERQLTRLWNTRNTLRLSFGQTHNQRQSDREWLRPAKSTDLIDFESLWRATFGVFVDPFVAGRLQSQFYTLDHERNATWVNPITLTESAGAAKTLLSDETRELLVRLGFGLRQFINRDALLDAAALTYGTKTTSDAGFEFVSELTTPLVEERLALTSKLTVFQAVYYSESGVLAGSERADYWRAPDINLEAIFTANITKYIMVNLYTQLLYDKEIALGGRFKETLSMGLTYTLF